MSIFGFLFGGTWDGYHDAARGIQPDHRSDAYWRGWWAAQRDPRLIAGTQPKPDLPARQGEPQE
jgi:hypothetical protein